MAEAKTTCDVEARAEDLEFGLMTVVVPPGGSTEPHEHKSQELWVIARGHGYVHMPHVDLPLRPGPATAIPADTMHAVHCESPEPLVLLAFWWKQA
jgi:mannose-6-phosphate isomerase-like protein (cupin superfamily)